jgi:hypothetical protein
MPERGVFVLLVGVFVDGVFVDGVFVDGVFVDGVFVDGVFVDGVLFGGVLLPDDVEQLPTAVGAMPVPQMVSREEPMDGAGAGGRLLEPDPAHDTLTSVTTNKAATVHSTARMPFTNDLPPKTHPCTRFFKPARDAPAYIFCFAIKKQKI